MLSRTSSGRTNSWLRRAAFIALASAVPAGCTPPPAPQVYQPPPPAPTPDRIVELQVFFNFDSHTIRPEAYPLLDNLAIALTDRRLAGYHFDINGHTDIIGRLAYNIALSELRAEAVVDYLAARGVPRETMHAQGFGPLQLLYPEDPRNAANRRVEIVSIR